MQIPCVYLPGPAPAVSVANSTVIPDFHVYQHGSRGWRGEGEGWWPPWQSDSHGVVRDAVFRVYVILHATLGWQHRLELFGKEATERRWLFSTGERSEVSRYIHSVDWELSRYIHSVDWAVSRYIHSVDWELSRYIHSVDWELSRYIHSVDWAVSRYCIYIDWGY
jgi:hypothetical protein